MPDWLNDATSLLSPAIAGLWVYWSGRRMRKLEADARFNEKVLEDSSVMRRDLMTALNQAHTELARVQGTIQGLQVAVLEARKTELEMRERLGQAQAEHSICNQRLLALEAKLLS